MNTNSKSKINRPFHLHLEHFFRKRFFVAAVLALLGVGIIKSDGRLLGIMRDAYSHGYDMIGAYLREESARTPLTYIVARMPSIASK